MLIEAFFKTLKHDDLVRTRSMRMDTVLYIINSKVATHYLPRLQKSTSIDRTLADIHSHRAAWKKSMSEEINKLKTRVEDDNAASRSSAFMLGYGSGRESGQERTKETKCNLAVVLIV